MSDFCDSFNPYFQYLPPNVGVWFAPKIFVETCKFTKFYVYIHLLLHICGWNIGVLWVLIYICRHMGTQILVVQRCYCGCISQIADFWCYCIIYEFKLELSFFNIFSKKYHENRMFLRFFTHKSNFTYFFVHQNDHFSIFEGVLTLWCHSEVKH